MLFPLARLSIRSRPGTLTLPNLTDSPMDTHKNFRTLTGRAEMVRAVVDRGLSKTQAARQYNTTPKTVAKWVERFRKEGVDGLRDRSSKRLSSPSHTPQATDAEVLRRQRDASTKAGPVKPDGHIPHVAVRDPRIAWYTKALLSLVALALVGLMALLLTRHSQETATLNSDYERGYPSRSINVVVPFPAGGPSDVVARAVTEQVGNTLGQSMVIENVGGAGGTIGSARVAAAPSDGYTLLAGSMGSHVAAPVFTPNLKYDSERHFGPIGFTALSPAVIVARKDF